MTSVRLCLELCQLCARAHLRRHGECREAQHQARQRHLRESAETHFCREFGWLRCCVASGRPCGSLRLRVLSGASRAAGGGASQRGGVGAAASKFSAVANEYSSVVKLAPKRALDSTSPTLRASETTLSLNTGPDPRVNPIP